MTGPLPLEPRFPDQVQEDRRGRNHEGRRDRALDRVGHQVAELRQHDDRTNQTRRKADDDDGHVTALVGRMAAPIEEAQDDGQTEDDQHPELKVLHTRMIRLGRRSRKSLERRRHIPPTAHR